ncbi:unnamed protein product [Prunus armeniaca]
MEDVTIIEKILRSMTPKFDYVVCFIEQSNDLDTLSIDELQSSLLVYEQSMNGLVVEEQALKVILKINQQEEVQVMVDLEEEDELGKALTSLPLSATTTMNLDIFNINVQRSCSNHMCGKKEFFYDIDESFRESMKLGINSSIAVMGKGNIQIQVNGII